VGVGWKAVNTIASRYANAIVRTEISKNNFPVGSGMPFLFLKYFNQDSTPHPTGNKEATELIQLFYWLKFFMQLILFACDLQQIIFNSL